MAITDDKYMEYDLTVHTYRFTNELIQDKLNENLEVRLGGEIEARLFREDTMYFIQDYCVNYGGTWDVAKKKQLIAEMIFLNGNGEREALQRAYVEFVRYALNDEGDMLGLQTGVDTEKGVVVSLDVLRGDRELSARLYRILRNSNLLFKGQFSFNAETDYTYGTDY
jgi:hypothetical protein